MGCLFSSAAEVQPLPQENNKLALAPSAPPAPTEKKKKAAPAPVALSEDEQLLEKLKAVVADRDKKLRAAKKLQKAALKERDVRGGAPLLLPFPAHPGRFLHAHTRTHTHNATSLASCLPNNPSPPRSTRWATRRTPRMPWTSSPAAR
jgi:hypothetical protein